MNLAEQELNCTKGHLTFAMIHFLPKEMAQLEIMFTFLILMLILCPFVRRLVMFRIIREVPCTWISNEKQSCTACCGLYPCGGGSLLIQAFIFECLLLLHIYSSFIIDANLEPLKFACLSFYLAICKKRKDTIDCLVIRST